jgi:peptide/nickel transport system permease protein
MTIVVMVVALIVSITLLNVFRNPARLSLPVDASDELVRAFEKNNNLTGGTFKRIVRMSANALHGDFGKSIWLHRPALAAALERVPATLLLAVPATLLGGGIGIAIGGAAARRPGTRLERTGTVIAYGSYSIPEFWVGMVLIYAFAVKFRLVPTGGYGDLSNMALPLAVLMWRPFSHSYLLTRASVLDEVEKNYVLTARAKGLSGKLVYRRHVRRNAIAPVTTVLFYELGRMFVGSLVVVEVLFSWPGLGRLAFRALQQGDVYLIAACVFLGSAVTALLNLAADVMVLIIDRRARVELSG